MCEGFENENLQKGSFFLQFMSRYRILCGFHDALNGHKLKKSMIYRTFSFYQCLNNIKKKNSLHTITGSVASYSSYLQPY